MSDTAWTENPTCRIKQIAAYSPSASHPWSAFFSLRISSHWAKPIWRTSPLRALDPFFRIKRRAPSSAFVLGVQPCESATAGGNLLPDDAQPETPLVHDKHRWPDAHRWSGLCIRLWNGRQSTGKVRTALAGLCRSLRRERRRECHRKCAGSRGGIFSPRRSALLSCAAGPQLRPASEMWYGSRFQTEGESGASSRPMPAFWEFSVAISSLIHGGLTVKPLCTTDF